MRSIKLACVAMMGAFFLMGCEVGEYEELRDEHGAIVPEELEGLFVQQPKDQLLTALEEEWNDGFGLPRDPHCGTVRWQSCSTVCPTQDKCTFCCNFHFQGDWDNQNYQTCLASCNPIPAGGGLQLAHPGQDQGNTVGDGDAGVSQSVK